MFLTTTIYGKSVAELYWLLFNFNITQIFKGYNLFFANEILYTLILRNVMFRLATTLQGRLKFFREIKSTESF